MNCLKPFTRGASSYGCGQCMPCRFNRRRIWTHRLMLEALAHTSASFITLTYDDDNLPIDGTLVPTDLQRFMKRIRHHANRCLRYYGVGEYGESTWRPHYHIALFGLDPTEKQYVDASWTLGYTHVGSLTLHSAQYIAGYINKKLTRKDDERLLGRYPEFARMSLRPGIGAPSIDGVAEALSCDSGEAFVNDNGDVPSVLRHAGRDLPLGRYMRSRLRIALGVDPDDKKVSASRAQQMLAVYSRYISSKEVSPITNQPQFWKGLQRYNDAKFQRALNSETKTKIFSQRGKKL